MIATHALVLAILAAPPGGLEGLLTGPLPLAIGMIVIFYLLVLRPQQTRAKQHGTMIAGLKRGDTVVLSSGLIGKVMRVEDKEVGIEVAQNVTVKVVRGMIAEVRARSEPAPANDAKS